MKIKNLLPFTRDSNDNYTLHAINDSQNVYIGKDDCKGNKIFTGDFIKVTTEFEGEMFSECFVISFDTNVCAFCAFKANGQPFEGLMNFGDSKIEVIGNVNANPYLVDGWADPLKVNI